MPGKVKFEDSRLDYSSHCTGEVSSQATEQTPKILTGDYVSKIMVVDDESALPFEFEADSTSTVIWLHTLSMYALRWPDRKARGISHTRSNKPCGFFSLLIQSWTEVILDDLVIRSLVRSVAPHYDGK